MTVHRAQYAVILCLSLISKMNIIENINYYSSHIKSHLQETRANPRVSNSVNIQHTGMDAPLCANISAV